MAGVVWLNFTTIDRSEPDGKFSSFLRFRPDGTVLDTVPWPEVPEVDWEDLRVRRRLPSGGLSIIGISVPYQPRGIPAWSPSGTFAVARSDRYRIEILPPPGTPDLGGRKVVTREVPPILVPEAERSEARKRLLERVSRVEGGNRLRIPQIPIEKPKIKLLRFGDDGRLWVWVSMPSRLRDGEWTESNAFDVFDLDGQFMGRVILPDSFWPVRMRGDHLWGIFLGVYDIESIRRYEIVWP
jgi:hypothetical protein